MGEHVYSVACNLGTFAAGSVPVFYIPKEFGGVTVTDAHFRCASGTITTPKLVKMTDVAVPLVAASGTVGTAATAVGTANTCWAFNITTAFVDPGTSNCWIGFTCAGTALDDVVLSLNYAQGK